MATKNGTKYLAEQVNSILPQLGPSDELIISDDASTDDTLDVIQTYKDQRIKLIKHTSPRGIAGNFETALQHSKGDYIFLADQDDVWMPNKVKVMMEHLAYNDLVISDCLLVDQSLKTKQASYFTAHRSGKGFIRNLVKNSYIGCCMAFNRKLLNRVLPFPKDIPIHDFWIGIIADLYFKVYFIPEGLLYHRRHGSNASTTGEMSSLSFSRKLGSRYRIIKNLFFHKSYAE